MPHLDNGLFGIHADRGEREAAEFVPVTLEELARVQIDADKAELRRARSQTKSGLVMSLESMGSRCEQLAHQIQVFGRTVPTKETLARIDAVRVADIRRVATRLLRGRPTPAAMPPPDLC